MKKFAALISVAVLSAAAMAAPADQIKEQVVVVETASARLAPHLPLLRMLPPPSCLPR